MKSFKVLLISSFLVFASQVTWALDAQIFRPINNEQGAFSVYKADRLGEGKWSLGLDYNFDKHPIEFGKIDHTKIDDLQNDLHSLNLNLQYKFNKKFALMVDVPFHHISDYEAASQALRSKDDSLGDIALRASILLGRSETWGFKIVPEVVFSTGEELVFLGSLGETYGLTAALSKFFNKSRWDFNIAYKHRDFEQNYNLETESALQGALAYTRDIGREKGFVWINEFKGEIPIGVDQVEINSPVEFITGFRHISKNDSVVWNIGYSKGLSHGYGSPDYRLFAGITKNFKPKNEPVTEAPVEEVVEPIEEKVESVKVEPQVIELQKIHFKSGSYVIKPESYVSLRRLVRILDHYKDITSFAVYGHTDSAGSYDANRSLSVKRAQAVVRYLVQNGIAPERLNYKGYGPDVPIADNASPQGRYQNRRVEFKVLGNNSQNIIFKNIE